MPVAPLVAAWGGRFPASSAGPLSAAPAAGAPLGGVPFCVDEFGPQARLIVEAAFGADLSADPTSWNWYDISGDVRYADNGRVTISPMGRADETSTAQPAGCGFVLDNSSGDYTAYSARSKWYPYVRRNTPIRARVNLTGQAADWAVRFQGYATGWTPSWDISAQVAVVAVNAQGITRRLSQGKTPLHSPIRRASTLASPVSSWPLEDAAKSTQAASAIAAGSPLVQSSVLPTWADDTDLAGSKALPKLVDGRTIWDDAILSGPVAGTSATGWSISVWVKATTEETVTSHSVTVLSWEPRPPGAAAPWQLLLAANTPDFEFMAAFSNSVRAWSQGTGILSFDGQWHHVVITAEQAGTAIDTRLYVDSILGAHSLAAAYTLTPITSISVLRAQDVVLGPVSVWAGQLAVFDRVLDADDVAGLYAAGDGFAGESPTARLARLCTEQGVPIEITGTSTSTMGAQSVATFLTLVRECETADLGVLYDGRSAGLSYVARDARYNAQATLVLDMAAGQVAHPFAPVDDDQRDRNLVKVDRGAGSSLGSSAVAQQVDGPLGTDAIEVYDTSVSVNVAADSALSHYASWLVHLGTVEGFRYPTLNLNLVASPEIAAAWLTTQVSSRVDVLNVTDVAVQHPSGDIQQLLEGWTETLSPLDWDVVANASTYQPWEVGVLDTSGFLDCGACVTTTELDTTGTAVAVAISDVCTWTHADGDYNITIDGEEMTVTAVSAASGSGSSWTQTLTVTRAVNGVVRGHSVGAEVHVSQPFVLAL